MKKSEITYGGIEAGGTKFVCGIGTSDGKIIEKTSFKTTDPKSTLTNVIEYFSAMKESHSFSKIGLASFGPLDLNPDSPSFGYITSTAKKGWKDFNIKGTLENSLGINVSMDTDVNAAALAEQKWGNAQGKNITVYLTVGTGIGGGVVINGKLLHGLLHPEIGHMYIRNNHKQAQFKGNCPYHGDCLEGLASGPALQAIWNISAEKIPPEHVAWDYEAEFLAEGLANIILILSPEIIILGGGVMQQTFLFPSIRNKVKKLLNGYIQKQEILKNIEDYILPAKLGSNAGLLGAFALAFEEEV
jgi:fructokinase